MSTRRRTRALQSAPSKRLLGLCFTVAFVALMLCQRCVHKFQQKEQDIAKNETSAPNKPDDGKNTQPVKMWSDNNGNTFYDYGNGMVNVIDRDNVKWNIVNGVWQCVKNDCAPEKPKTAGNKGKKEEKKEEQKKEETKQEPCCPEIHIHNYPPAVAAAPAVQEPKIPSFDEWYATQQRPQQPQIMIIREEAPRQRAPLMLHINAAGMFAGAFHKCTAPAPTYYMPTAKPSCREIIKYDPPAGGNPNTGRIDGAGGRIP